MEFLPPFKKPDVLRMRKSKTPKRIFFISLLRPNGDATKEKSTLQLLSKTFRCSCIAIASILGKHTNVYYFYVLNELNPRLLWINDKAILENTIPSNQFYLVQLFSFPKGLTYILSATYWYPYLLLGISDSYW
jgi:hypothetical protein